MDKWLAGLIIVAVGLPLLMFFGNLESEVSEEGEAGSSTAHEQANVQQPPAGAPETNLSYQPEASNSDEKDK